MTVYRLEMLSVQNSVNVMNTGLQVLHIKLWEHKCSFVIQTLQSRVTLILQELENDLLQCSS